MSGSPRKTLNPSFSKVAGIKLETSLERFCCCAKDVLAVVVAGVVAASKIVLPVLPRLV